MLPEPHVPKPVPDSLWRLLAEGIESGLIVFDHESDVVFANRAAGDLLEYDAGELLVLDLEDVIALFQAKRLEVERLTTVLRQDLLGPRATNAYRVATQVHRLVVTPFGVDLMEGRYRVILIERDANWREELIATSVIQDMRSPITYALTYSEALLRRLMNKGQTDELIEFTRLIRSGAETVLDEWQDFFVLYNTEARRRERLADSPRVALQEVLFEALSVIRQNNGSSLPSIGVMLPPDLPNIRAEPQYLHVALVMLLLEITERMSSGDSATISALRRADGVVVEIAMNSSKFQGVIRPDVFDVMPMAIIEQLIIMQGGRLWVETREDGTTLCSFLLPMVG